MRLTKTISRKYYKNRLWKITFTLTMKHRLVKHYERRDCIGSSWAYIRGIVCSNDE